MIQTTGFLTPRRLKRFFGSFFRWISIFFLLVFFVGPYLWMAASAFKSRTEIFRYVSPVTWRTFIPLNPTLENFSTLLIQEGFWRPLLNSIMIAIATVCITIFISSMIAFALARMEFAGRQLVFVIILSTLLIPFEAIMVPMFLVIQNLGLDNTYPGIFIPWVADAFIIFLLRQHFLGIPSDLQDAALMDGCTTFQVYWKVMLPNIRPALVSAAFIKFIYSWDAYIWPLIITRDPKKEVITVAIAKLFTDQDILWELIFAASFLVTIPVAILFIFLQRYYVQGIATTGIRE